MLASARRRRRLAWAAGGVLAAGLVAGLIVAFPKPNHRERFSNEPDQVYRAPKHHSFGAGRQDAVLSVAANFVRTAVARHGVAESWKLVAPSLRQGYTRSSWAHGDIPVVPYPVRLAKWRLSYSLVNEVGLQVALFPRRHVRLRPTVFDLTLVRRHRGWLVSAFSPSPSAMPLSGGQELTSIGLPRLAPVDRGRGAASAAWLLAPLVVVGLLVLGLAALGGSRWYRARRAYRAYAQR